MLFISCLDELTDSHIVSLSRRITSEQELHDVGTGALRLDKTITDNALHNHRTSIQDAAREVLHTWANMQVKERTEVYVRLLEALRKYEMNQLAEYLKTLVEGTKDSSQVAKCKKHYHIPWCFLAIVLAIMRGVHCSSLLMSIV